MVQKKAAVVILYQPDESVKNRIRSYIQHVEKLYIIDNTEAAAFSTHPLLSDYPKKITLINEGVNEGIAKRLNQACSLALEEGFDYLLTMDQDSWFDETVVKAYFKCINDFKERATVSMFGVNHEKKITGTDCSYQECNFLITSGSVINLEAYKKVGPFDEDLFIDFVDAEYCFKSIEHGFKIIKFPNIFMHHSLGEIQTKISLKNLKPRGRTFHSPARLYYMTRNILYIQSKYTHRFKKDISKYKKDLLNRIKNNLLYKNNKVQTIKMLLKAFKDYKNKRMGKLQD
ncbi:glycosyltransferase family 2 protein [Parafilimonas terrae]|uniref:Rhamnosyltransferase n=1 Tax=Parafilimonas terrae TaxID=1465490 RepID=A0A1I5UFB2_9BACT|nr:glycosyltransferase family 2 protein [Parafilimonas terrae]SFP93945.1 rhamnosyltransferase [Parafilimonas terrae]